MNQKEGFAVMQYRCQDCGDIEFIWNSRDAVTPFMVSCGVCPSGRKQHINWHLDYQRKGLPSIVNRVFVTITPELAIRLAEKKWELFEEKGFFGYEPGPKEETLRQWAEYMVGGPACISKEEYLNER